MRERTVALQNHGITAASIGDYLEALQTVAAELYEVLSKQAKSTGKPFDRKEFAKSVKLLATFHGFEIMRFCWVLCNTTPEERIRLKIPLEVGEKTPDRGVTQQAIGRLMKIRNKDRHWIGPCNEPAWVRKASRAIVAGKLLGFIEHDGAEPMLTHNKPIRTTGLLDKVMRASGVKSAIRMQEAITGKKAVIRRRLGARRLRRN